MSRPRGDRGFTLVEVLAATMVLTVGILSVISIYFAAGRFGQKAIRQTEAARLARAVANYMERRPKIELDQVALAAPANWVQSEPLTGFAILSPVRLVWRCEVTRHVEWSAGAPLYALAITVSADQDGDRLFDGEPEDRTIATFVTQLAPRP